LNPPPPSFSRAADPRFPYPAFQPIWLHGLHKKHLEACFSLIPPTSFVNPHPFATHDVGEVDWVRFLEDIQIAGALTGQQRLISNIAPISMHVGATGFLITKAIEGRMKRKKEQPVTELIEIWNDHFFRPRRMYVILFKG
ncbi:hypothetical protein SISNIDRAFT_401831, partial [Sistotremastrum niveocremeum HHB9708]